MADLEKVSRAEDCRIVLTSSPQLLAPLVEQAVASERDRYAARRVTLRTDLPPSRPGAFARIDPDRLREALGNLLDNALRHTPAGGHGTVTLRSGEETTSTTCPSLAAKHVTMHIRLDRFRSGTAKDLHPGWVKGLLSATT